MSNNSGEKLVWEQIDQKLLDGWYIVKLDGSSFKPLRVPNISLETLSNYNSCMKNVALKVFERFSFFHCCYLIDDEFHFLFHTNNVKKDLRKVSKVVVLPATYTTALVNGCITKEKFESRKSINFGKLCYDGRLVKLTKNEIFPYFEDIINHGKMFLGNIIVGDGKYFVRKTMIEILSEATKNLVILEERHQKLFGTFIDTLDNTFELTDFNIDKLKKQIEKEVNKYSSNFKPFL